MKNGVVIYEYMERQQLPSVAAFGAVRIFTNGPPPPGRSVAERYRVWRKDATVSFIEKRPRDVVMQMARLPGVLAVEPYREVPIRIRNGSIERRVMISGRPRDADLNRVIDVDLRPVVLPDVGLAISGLLAQILGVHVGDFVEVDLLEGQRRTVSLPVSALVEDYFGIRGMMDAGALARLSHGPR